MDGGVENEETLDSFAHAENSPEVLDTSGGIEVSPGLAVNSLEAGDADAHENSNDVVDTPRPADGIEGSRPAGGIEGSRGLANNSLEAGGADAGTNGVLGEIQVKDEPLDDDEVIDAPLFII